MSLLSLLGAGSIATPAPGGGGGGGSSTFQPVDQYASNTDLNTYLLHDQSGTVGQRFDPGLPDNAWFDNVHYISATGASTGDGLTVGAPVSLWRAWAIARTHRDNAESAVFYMADGNYRMGTTVGVNTGLGGLGNYIESELTANYEKPILFIGSGSACHFDCNIGSGRGEPLYVGGATNFHMWRWKAKNGDAGVFFGMIGLGFNNDTMGPLVDCTFRYVEVTDAAGSLLDIKHDCRRVIISDFLLQNSGVSTRSNASTSPYGEGLYHGHNGLYEGFDASVGGNGKFRNSVTHNIPCFTGPLDTVLLRGVITDINGGEAIDAKPYGLVHLKDVHVHDIEPYYSGAIALHVLNPGQPEELGGGYVRRQKGYVTEFEDCIIEDIRTFSGTTFVGGSPSSPHAMQLNSSCTLTNVVVGSPGNTVGGTGIKVGWTPASSQHPTLPAAMHDATTAMTLTGVNVDISNCTGDDFQDGTGELNQANYPVVWSFDGTSSSEAGDF